MITVKPAPGHVLMNDALTEPAGLLPEVLLHYGLQDLNPHQVLTSSGDNYVRISL